MAAFSIRPKFAANIGDGSNTVIQVTHNLGTLDVVARVYRNSGSKDEAPCDVLHTSESIITLVFRDAPAVDEFRVVVLG